MSKIQKASFVNKNINKNIDISKTKQNSKKMQELAEAGLGADDLARVDLNHDGHIQGEAELKQVFSLADRLDNDGQRHSLIDADFSGHLRPAGQVLTTLGLLQKNRSADSQPLGALRSVDEQLADMSTHDKVAMLVMEYGSSRYQPKSGSMIVNQTHLNERELGHLSDLASSYEARHGRKLIIATDQEGGKVNRMGRMPGYRGVHFASAKEMQSMSLAEIRSEGKKAGTALAQSSVNMVLGPVLDVADPHSLMDKMQRSFGSNSEEVTTRAQAFIDGLREANPNMTLIAKHYPGYDARGNSDISVVSSHATRAEIAERSRPFDEVKGLDGVMLNSIRYDAYGGEPACFSKELISAFRSKHPDAVVMTDDLYASSLLPSKELRDFKEYVTFKNNPRYAKQMDKLRERYPQFENSAGRSKLWGQIDQALKDNVKKAFMAGADHFLIMDARKSGLIREALQELVHDHPEYQQQLDQSAKRLLQMRQRMSGSVEPQS